MAPVSRWGDGALGEACHSRGAGAASLRGSAAFSQQSDFPVWGGLSTR